MTLNVVDSALTRRDVFSLLPARLAALSQFRQAESPLPSRLSPKPFVVYYYANSLKYFSEDIDRAINRSQELWQGVGVVYFRLPWFVMNPQEGVFDWDVLSRVAEKFCNIGLKLAFRITCSENRLRYPSATPQWVFDKGAKFYRFWSVDRNPDGTKEILKEPDFGDSIFIDEHARFLNQFRRFLSSYAGSIEFLDVGSLGVYGEGHTKSSTNVSYGAGVIFEHLEMNISQLAGAGFPLLVNHNLADLVEGERDTSIFPKIARMGFGFRDDSIFINPTRPYYDADIAAKYFADRVVVLETAEVAGAISDGRWSDEVLLDALSRYGATHLGVHWYPSMFFANRKGLVSKILSMRG